MSQQQLPNRSGGIRTEVLVALIGAIATIIAAAIAVLPNFFNNATPQSSPTITIASTSTNTAPQQAPPPTILNTATINTTASPAVTNSVIVPTGNTPLPQNTDGVLINESKTIASGANNDHVFGGTENIPVIITMTTKDKIRYWIEIFDPNGGKVFTSGYLSANSQTPFTPQMMGEHTIRALSDSGFGEYTIKVEPLDPQQTTGDTKVPLQLGTRVSGSIAAQAYDDYWTFANFRPIAICGMIGHHTAIMCDGRM